MSMQILEKLFGSSARVKIIKLFLFNPDENFDVQDISTKTKVSVSQTRKELNNLDNMGLIRKKSFFKEIELKTIIKKKRVNGYILEQNFIYINHLRSLLINTEPFKHADVGKRIAKIGKLKLLAVSGIFIQNDDSRIDMLIIADEVKERSLKNLVLTLESEIGRELRYAVLGSEDFKYRLGIHDRLVRDVFDFPHHIVVDRLGFDL
jgi:hypothetical protein